MKVILREEVENLGDIGDMVEVAAGYGRNYLIPKGLAVRASERNVKEMEHEKRLQAQRLSKAKGAAEEYAGKLQKLSLRISKKVGEGDRIYGSVTAQEIAFAVQAAGEKLDRRRIQLEAPIKALGVYQVPVKVHPEVAAELSVWVVAESEGAPEGAADTAAGSEAEKKPERESSGAEAEGGQTEESE